MRPPGFSLLSFALCLAALSFGSCMSEDEAGEPAEIVALGDTLPVFSVVMNDGALVSNASLKGSVSVITFFHTDCPDCQRAFPGLDSLYKAHADHVRFVCISRAEGAEGVAAYWEKEGLSLPYSAQSDRAVYQRFARSVIPRVYVVDRTGRIQGIFVETFASESVASVIEKYN